MKSVAILGAGGMGTALALLFGRVLSEVRLWSRDPDHAAELARTRVNERHLPGIVLPEEIRITSSAKIAGNGADLLVAAVPTSYLRATMVALAHRPAAANARAQRGQGNRVRLVCTPQPDHRRHSRSAPGGRAQRPEPRRRAGTRAARFGRGLRKVGRAQCSDPRRAQPRSVSGLHQYRPTGGRARRALKNILGIAAGICDGLAIGDNGKAALLTRGLVEIARLGVHLGARSETFYGLAGVGDIVTTCYSPYGRNRSVGERIGRGESIDQVLSSMVNVAEGVPTTRSVHQLASERNVEMPITSELYQVLFEGKSPMAAVNDLMVRAPKVESR